MFPQIGTSSDFYRYEHVYEQEKTKAKKLILYEDLGSDSEREAFLKHSKFNSQKYDLVDLEKGTDEIAVNSSASTRQNKTL